MASYPTIKRLAFGEGGSGCERELPSRLDRAAHHPALTTQPPFASVDHRGDFRLDENAGLEEDAHADQGGRR
jgi:hypothetical protein